VKLFQWRGRTSKKAFTERFQAALQQHLPEAAVDQLGELELRVRRTAQVTQTIWLGRAYQEFCKDPADADEIIARWLRNTTEIRIDAIDVDCIIPVIKDHGWLEQNGRPASDLWSEPYNTELLIVFAEFREGLHFCNRSAVADLRIPLTQLRDRAFANLQRRITQVSVERRGGDLYMLGAGGTIDASLLLLEDLTKDSRIELEGAALVAVPDRDTFLLVDDASPFAVFGIAQLAAEYYRSEPDPISRQLFRKDGGVWVPLDPAPLDAHHPIPDLTVIDVFLEHSGGVELGLVIASPLGTDPRSLFRLFTKLDLYLREIEANRWGRNLDDGTPQSARITVKMHRDCDPIVAELVRSHGDWAKSRGATLALSELVPSE
jgi:uncharacterized protein YtpQ (UPF0354 family)